MESSPKRANKAVVLLESQRYLAPTLLCIALVLAPIPVGPFPPILTIGSTVVVVLLAVFGFVAHSGTSGIHLWLALLAVFYAAMPENPSIPATVGLLLLPLLLIRPTRWIVLEEARRCGRGFRWTPVVAAIGVAAVAARAVTVWSQETGTTILLSVPAWATSDVVLVLGIVLFSAVNAAGEELLWRGAAVTSLQGTMSSGLGAHIAIVCVTSLSFGLAHYDGFPSGWVGAAMAGAFGVVLAGFRLRWGGLAAPLLAHFLVDVAIGVEILF